MSSYSSAEDEYDSDEPPKLQLDIGRLKDRASDALKSKCTSAKKLTRGRYHEIIVLEFQESRTAPRSLAQAGFHCIARFTREGGDLAAKGISETVTAKYLKQHTDIPVPEIYYEDLDPDNDVGAPFVLMERMPGRHLYKIWDDLSLEHKKTVLSQIASIVAQLASLQFDDIGCLAGEGVGPIISPCLELPMGPFRTTGEYLRSFISTNRIESPQLKTLYGQIREELDRLLALNKNAAYLRAPFGLIHADFDGQNMLFVDSSDDSGPKFSGLIDFDYAHTGPLYFLYDYPIFIQDVSWSKEAYAENAILRAHFVRAVYDALSNVEAQATFIACMNAKSFALNEFQDLFMLNKFDESTLINLATDYLKGLRDGTGLAYSGRLDFVPERYAANGERLPPNSTDCSKDI